MGISNVQLAVTVALLAAVCVAFAALYLQAAVLRWRIKQIESDRLLDGARLSAAGDRASSGALRSFSVVVDIDATAALSTLPFFLGARLPAGASPCGGGGSPTAEFTERVIVALEPTPAAQDLATAMMTGHVTTVAIGGHVCVIDTLDLAAKSGATKALAQLKKKRRTPLVFALGVATSAQVPGCAAPIPTSLPFAQSAPGGLRALVQGARLVHLWGWGRGADIEGAARKARGRS